MTFDPTPPNLAPEPEPSLARQCLGLDLRSLALFRVGLALVTIIDLIQRAFDLTAHYTDLGVSPRSFLLDEYGWSSYFSLHYWASGSAVLQGGLFVVHGLVALALLVGWRTRLMTILGFVLLASLQKRNPILNNAGDDTFRIIFFWAMLLPLGARWSIDAALNTAKQRASNTLLSIPGVAILLQVCFIYWFAVLLKLAVPAWREGDAVAYAMALDFHLTDFGQWLAQYDALMPAFTLLTLVVELLGPFLLFLPRPASTPARLLAFVTFAGLHATFGLAFYLGIFPLMSICAWLVVLPGGLWDALDRRLVARPKRTGLVVHYDGECGFCQKLVHVLRTMLLLHHAEIRRCQDDPAILEEMKTEDSWIVVDHAGRHHRRFGGVAYLLRISPIAWPLGLLLSLPPIVVVGDAVYRVAIAPHRTIMAWITAWMRPAPVRERPWRVEQWTAAILLVYVLLLNVRSLSQLHPIFGKLVPAATALPAKVLRIDQAWTMFTKTLEVDGWWVIEGVRADGSTVDLLTGVSPASWDKPARVHDTFTSYRWYMFMTPTAGPDSPRWDHLAAYLCRTWNADHEDAPVESLDVVLMFEIEGQVGAADAQRQSFATIACADVGRLGQPPLAEDADADATRVP